MFFHLQRGEQEAEATTDSGATSHAPNTYGWALLPVGAAGRQDAASWQGDGGSSLVLDASLLPDPPASIEEPDLEETDPHVIFFTSGSTGRPKGVKSNLQTVGGDPKEANDRLAGQGILRDPLPDRAGLRGR